MSIKEHLSAYKTTLSQMLANYVERNKDYFTYPVKYYVKPFKIFGDLYYVGDARCCIHLLDTHDGLIIFDSGMPHTIHLLIEAIWELGFDPRDIKYIIHSHGHYDHFGATNDFKELFGCKDYLSAIDAALIKEKPERTLLKYSANPYARTIVSDYEFNDGDHIKLGKYDIRCVIVPSHTPGTTAFFFDLQEGSEIHHVGYFGGVGFLSVYKEFLNQYDLPLSQQDDFFKSLKKVYNEEVDLVLGNHPSQNATLEKRKKMIEHPEDGNPFISKTEWKEFLDSIEEQFKAFVDAGF